MAATLVMDLGGTRLKAGVAEAGLVEGPIVAEVPAGRDAILSLVRETGRSALGARSATAAGLCVPGLVDDGTLVSLPGKLAGLEGVALSGFLRETFDVERVAVTNDAIAYAVGETAHGAGRGCRRTVVVTIGTGVGVTVVEQGRPATGGALGAGILGGFIPISDDDDLRDSTGQTGTIEALCAAHRILEACDGAYRDIPAAYEAYAAGEATARGGIDLYRWRLARGLVALAHAHAPDRIVLGGGPMTPDNPVLDGLEAMVNKRLFGTYRVEVAVAALGDRASLAGLAQILERE